MGPFILYGKAFSHGCTPVHQLNKFELISQMSNPLIWSLSPPFASCRVNVRTYSQIQRFCTYVLWDTCELWLYACTETVRIGIVVTNLPCTVSILLVVIWILYSWCTDVQPFLNGLYICILGYLEQWLYSCTEAVRIGIEVTNVPFSFNPFGGISDPV